MIPFWICSSRTAAIAALFAAAALGVSCKTSHEVELKPTHHTIEVKPIFLTVDVNIRVQRELDRFFDEVEKEKKGEGT